MHQQALCPHGSPCLVWFSENVLFLARSSDLPLFMVQSPQKHYVSTQVLRPACIFCISILNNCSSIQVLRSACVFLDLSAEIDAFPPRSSDLVYGHALFGLSSEFIVFRPTS
jgi:hypothetical protein